MRFAVLSLAAALVFSGCAGYKLGPSNGLEAGSRSVQINPPLNKTLEPRLSEELNHQIRRQVQRDGTYKLATREDGDVVVSTTIMEYNRSGEIFQRRDTLTARDYRIHLVAHVTAYDRITGKNLVDREFTGRTLVRVGSDQAAAERQALPLLTEDLARIITSAIADGEW